MSYDIGIFPPCSYVKKTHKQIEFSETNEFLQILERKINDWNLNYVCEKETGRAYKLKYGNLEKVYLSNIQILIYVVCSSSISSFESSLKKLMSTCQKKDIFSHILVVSLCQQFPDIKKDSLDVINFKEESWSSDESYQWQQLRDILNRKIQDIEDCNNNSISTNSTIPHHSSKIKTFFHNLPSKFEHKKDKTFKNQNPTGAYVPNIKISEYNGETLPHELEIDADEHQQINEHTKLFLNSPPKSLSQKTKDSGLNLDSPTSTCSGSKKSESTSHDKNKSFDIGFDGVSETSQSSERSLDMYTFLEKPKSEKSSKHNFKEKASKALHSASCLQSSPNKQKKHLGNALSDVAFFSSFVISASSDIPINNLRFDEKSNTITSSFKQRCKSESPSDDIPSLLKSKNHSWNENMVQYGENIWEELTDIEESNEQPTILKATTCNGFELNNAIKNNNIISKQINCFRIFKDSIKPYYNLEKSKNDIEDKKNLNIKICESEVLKEREIENIIETKKIKLEKDEFNFLETVRETNEYYKCKNEDSKMNKNRRSIINTEPNIINANYIDNFELKKNKIFKIQEEDITEIIIDKENITDENNENHLSDINFYDVTPTNENNNPRNFKEIKKNVNSTFSEKDDFSSLTEKERTFEVKQEQVNEINKEGKEKIIQELKEHSDYETYFNVQYVTNIQKKEIAMTNICKETKSISNNTEFPVLETFQLKKDSCIYISDKKIDFQESKEKIKESKTASVKSFKHFKEKSYKKSDIIDAKSTQIPLQIKSKMYSSLSEISDSIVIPSQSHLSKLSQSLVRNPFIVASLFTVVALTAPTWSIFSVYDVISGIFKKDIVQVIPNHIVSASRLGTVSVKSSLKKFFIAVPSNNLIISGYKIFYC